MPATILKRVEIRSDGLVGICEKSESTAEDQIVPLDQLTKVDSLKLETTKGEFQDRRELTEELNKRFERRVFNSATGKYFLPGEVQYGYSENERLANIAWIAYVEFRGR